MAGDLTVFVEELPVTLDHLGGFDVHAALVLICRRLDVALVVQPAERLGAADVAQVVEHLVPEAGIEQVQHGVLHAADVQIDAADTSRCVGHPVALHVRIHQDVVIGRVEVAQVVPARSGPLGHGAEFTAVGALAVAEVIGGGGPLCGAA